MTLYFALKHIHMLCALLSIFGFITRSMWAFRDSSLLQNKFVKIAPHIIDTVLLLSAIGLVVGTQQYPFVNGWVTAKLFALVAYIVLGVFTLKKAKDDQQRVVFFTLALLTFIYIVFVAISRDAFFFL
jgi:uncharacterized membrane protein SirB2